jgi:hypothetical protein
VADCSPSIPGFCFPTTIVVGRADFVQASGIENRGSNVIQFGGADDQTTKMNEIGGFSLIEVMDQHGGIDQTEKVGGFQGAGNSGQIIVRKLAVEPGGTFLVYDNIVQNPSFENNLSRWATGISGPHTANVVDQFPPARGFDNGNPADLEVPDGSRMLHIIKAGEDGYMAVAQLVQGSETDTSFLGDFSFSVASDSAFVPEDSPAGRYGMVALQFVLNDITQWTLAYQFSSGGVPPNKPPSFPTINQIITLSQASADSFQTYTRDLISDLTAGFDFNDVVVWIVTDMQDTLFVQEFDTLWDNFILEVGQLQPELFPTSTDQQLIVTSNAELVSSKNFLGVLGTSSTYEREFDDSPFLFLPSEPDPNTDRDRREVEPFLLFSKAFVNTYEALRANPHEGWVIAVNGEEFNEAALADENVLANPSFETGSLAFWQSDLGTGGSITVRTDSIDEGGIPAGLLPPDGEFWTYIVKGQDGNDSAYIQQTVRFSRTFSSRVVKRIGWAAVFDFIASTNRRNQFSLVFYHNEKTVYHLRYRITGQGLPNLPSEFPDAPVNASQSLSATEDVVNTYLRQFLQDTGQAVFDFDRLDVWWIADSNNVNDTNTYVDDFAVTMSIPSTELLATTDLGWINTNAPVTSGIPFTISGSEDVNQIDQTVPFFDETAPASGTRFNPTEGTLSFHVKDQHSTLDTTNIDVWVDDIQIVNASTVQTSATWPSGNKTVIGLRDIRYDFTRVTDYPQQATVVVSGELADLANPVSNQAITDYRFTVLGSGTLDATISGSADGDPPIIILGYPDDLTTQVSPTADISWSLTDNASGVDPTTVRLLLNGAVKIEDDLATVGEFTRIANSERGFDYVYNPDGKFGFGTTVTGIIEADDFAGNSASREYEFTITPDDTLSITNFFIDQGSSILTNSGTQVSFCLEDFTHGVNVSGSFVLSNGVVPSGLMIVSSGIAASGTGPEKLTYTFPVAGNIDDRTDYDILVHGENFFPGPFPVIVEQTFGLRSGYEVDWPNRNTGIGSGAETVFPFTTNIQVLAEVLNFGKNFNQASLYYRFLTENLHSADLGASLVSNIKVADLPAFLNSLNTIFEYGKTIVLEVEVADNNGNQLSFTHTFTIEDKPN